MNDYTNTTNFDELIELESGAIGSESRTAFDNQAKMFIENVLLEEAELETNLADNQLPTTLLDYSEISPLVKSLSGVANFKTDFDFKKEYAKYLTEKYE